MYIVTVQIYSCARDGNLVRASQRNLAARGKFLIWGPIFSPNLSPDDFTRQGESAGAYWA
jgi:hypothetical protein